MKASTVILGLAMAFTASALPNDKGGDKQPPSGICPSNSQQPVCCNGGDVISIALCSLLGGNTCDGSTYCCQTNSNGGINVNVLDCVRILD